jgi:hypothetical protein
MMVCTSIFGDSLTLQFLVICIPPSHSRYMISIPEQIPHSHTNSKGNTDVQEDLSAKPSDNGREIADLVRSRSARWRRVFRPVNHRILHIISHTSKENKAVNSNDGLTKAEVSEFSCLLSDMPPLRVPSPIDQCHPSSFH